MENVKLGLLGVIVGDALGLPVQFKDRAWFVKNPVSTMTGHGVFSKPKGSWSDDGSLTLALAASLADGYDVDAIMNEFEAWFFYGKYTQDGQAYDIGQTTANAIMNYHRGIPANKCGGRSYYDNGNGSLMRILPLLFYLRKIYGECFIENDQALAIIHDVSALTHAHALAILSCGLYLSVANELLNGLEPLSAVKKGLEIASAKYNTDALYAMTLKEYDRIKDLDTFKALPLHAIRSSGFVKDTLEASLWCLLNASSYEEAVLKAVNLGHDTDTTAAVCGGLAALAFKSIKPEWIDAIHHKEILDEISENLHRITQ